MIKIIDNGNSEVHVNAKHIVTVEVDMDGEVIVEMANGKSYILDTVMFSLERLMQILDSRRVR